MADLDAEGIRDRGIKRPEGTTLFITPDEVGGKEIQSGSRPEGTTLFVTPDEVGGEGGNKKNTFFFFSPPIAHRARGGEKKKKEKKWLGRIPPTSWGVTKKAVPIGTDE